MYGFCDVHIPRSNIIKIRKGYASLESLVMDESFREHLCITTLKSLYKVFARENNISYNF